MIDLILGSKEIVDRALKEYPPVAKVLMMSGGNDSVTTYYVLKELGVKLDFILHANTYTGIPETTEFVRKFAEDESVPYLEASAEGKYEEYVRRKGFFGQGSKAHSYSYHILKQDPFNHQLSKHIRKGQRNCKILLFNGVRSEESKRRAKHLSNPIKPQTNARSNIWVSPIVHWTKADCKGYLGQGGCKLNPVSQILCRSGECLCGTMQNQEVRREASYWYPKWGEWLDNLEAEVKLKFPWGWGESIPKDFEHPDKPQATPDNEQPLCASCLNS